MSATDELFLVPFEDAEGRVSYKFNRDVVVYTPEEAARIKNTIFQMMDDISEMQDLIKEMWPHVRHRARACQECQWGPDCTNNLNEPCYLYAIFERRMYLLGIEVDDHE